jgi:hypothetical protein
MIIKSSFAPCPCPADNLLDTYGYVESKPYARPMVPGLSPMRGLVWVGFTNAVRAILPTNALHVEVPRGVYVQHTNPPALRGATAAFAGGAPTRGIYTGVGE